MYLVPLLLAVTTLAQDTVPRAAPAIAASAMQLDLALQQDPADSLYRAARRVLNEGQYTRAAELFRLVRQRYARSAYVADSYYWEAFALYRAGDDEGLRVARTALRTQLGRYRNASTRRDAQVLLQRVQGELARRGDADAAAEIAEHAEAIAPTPPTPPVPPVGPGPGAPRPPGNRSSSCDDEDDISIAALNALLQMDAERAIPILKSVLARRDAGATCLRRKAVFLVSQKRSPETARILLDAVRSDPDQEVREQAVFWLSQVPGEETVAALDSVLRATSDPTIQEKAVFALSQHRSERAGQILRDYARRRDAPANVREKAIFWLGQRKGEETQRFLRELYPTLETEDLKDKVLFAVSQSRDETSGRWLLDVALNEREGMEVRKKALFWAGQRRATPTADFVTLYGRVQNREIKEHLIFVFSQRSRDPAAVDQLFAIARNETDRELRKKAVFWLGQSRDPRVAQFLQELINQ